MSPDPKPAAGVRLFILDDEGILFAPTTRELHSLNPAATLVWCLLEEGRSRAAIARSLSQAQQCPLPESKVTLAKLLRQWGDQGLLAGTEAAAAPAPGAEAATPLPTDVLPPCVVPEKTLEHRYRLLGREICVRFETDEQEDWVHPVLGHLEVPPGTAQADQTIDLVARDGVTLVYRDRQRLEELPAIDQVAPFIKALFWLDVMKHQELSLIFHAGVVGAVGRGILLPAAAGSGKSTLTAALALAGFSFFSDEVAIIARDRFAVRPVPLGICVKSTGWDTLMPLYPQLAEVHTHYRGDGKTVRYLPPPAGPGSDAFYPVAAIVFPRYAPDAETAMRPLGKAEAMRRLLKECLVVQYTLDERNVGQLVNWVTTVPCYDLHHSSLAEACDLFLELTASWS